MNLSIQGVAFVIRLYQIKMVKVPFSAGRLHDHEDGDNSAIPRNLNMCSPANQGIDHSTSSNIWRENEISSINIILDPRLGKKNALSSKKIVNIVIQSQTEM